jgi:hypothetical protein
VRAAWALATLAAISAGCEGSSKPGKGQDSDSRGGGGGAGQAGGKGTGGAAGGVGGLSSGGGGAVAGGGGPTPPPSGSEGSGAGGSQPVSPDAPVDLPAGAKEARLLDRVRVSGVANEGKDRHARAMLDLGPGPFSDVRLTVELDTTCYPFERSNDDPPPAGQLWPPKCDAFDRRFEVLLDPASNPGEKPGIELVRAITPFGGPMRFEADITDVVNGLPGAHVFEAFIDTWPDRAGQVSGSDGGWFVTATVVATPGKAPREVLAVIPVYFDSQTMPEVGPFQVTVPPGTSKTRIEYRTTGHTLSFDGTIDRSACNGPAEEFCRRTHTLLADGLPIAEFSPYRADCSSLCKLVTRPGTNRMYCEQNPRGAIASVRAPRANWCPGDASAPKVIDGSLSVGSHQLSWRVSGIQNGGMWRTSATLFAYQ